MMFISVDIPSCPSALSSFRSANFTSANVTWQQPLNSPPVTSTTITYCPTSSPNCGNSVTCTSPCTISGLDPCLNYSITVTPSNNCGSATGCTINSVTIPPKGQCSYMITTFRNHQSQLCPSASHHDGHESFLVIMKLFPKLQTQ